MTGSRLALSLLLLLLPYSAGANDCIGLVVASSDRFWDEMNEGARSAGREFGYRIYFRGPTAEAGDGSQAAMLEDIESLGCVGLLLAPDHPDRQEQVERFMAAGVVTVFVDRGLPGMSAVPVVATDNYAAGQFAARQLMNLLPEGQKNIGLFRLDPNVITTTAREQGFIDEISAQEYRLVVDIYAGTMIGDVRFAVLREIQSLKTPLHGIFTPNETTTVGVVDTVTYADMLNKPIIVGFDSNKYIRRAIRQGNLAGTVVQKPFEMGYLGVQLIHDQIEFGKVPESIVTGVDFETGTRRQQE